MGGLGVTCLVTIHGVGFQQAPSPGIEGYADRLHRWLIDDARIGSLISLNPLPGDRGQAQSPVYVCSDWPVDQPLPDQGIGRVGTWSISASATGSGEQLPFIDHGDVPLVEGEADIVHVALVYTGLEERQTDLMALLVTAGIGLDSLDEYTSVGGYLGKLAKDLGTRLLHRRSADQPSPGLRVRSDLPALTSTSVQGADPGGFDQVLRQVDDDMAAYVARNAMRERVRDFVAEVLIRLAYRDDVSSIVVNGHSQGTVAAYDTLRRMPRPVPDKVGCLITAGSPLRKYATSLTWGSEVGAITAIPRWLNYYDPNDPVADPLRPPASWRPGDPIPDPMPPDALLHGLNIDRNVVAPVEVIDRRVNNLANSAPGGLQAHNYWDNTVDFVPSLAEELLTARRIPASA